MAKDTDIVVLPPAPITSKDVVSQIAAACGVAANSVGTEDQRNTADAAGVVAVDDPVHSVRQRMEDHLQALELNPNLTGRQKAFLRAYSVQPVIARAAKIAGVGRSRHFEWMQTIPEYAEAFEEAKQLGADFLEAEAYERAVNGWLEPVYQKGNLVGYIRKFDSNLLRLLLQGHRPELYAPKGPNIQVGGERSTVQINIDQTTYEKL